MLFKCTLQTDYFPINVLLTLPFLDIRIKVSRARHFCLSYLEVAVEHYLSRQDKGCLSLIVLLIIHLGIDSYLLICNL